MHNTMKSLPPPKRLVLPENAADNWKRFHQRMDLLFTATAATTERTLAQKSAIFLHGTGQEAIDIFNVFRLTPSEREDCHLIVQAFEEYCSPNCHQTYGRYVFRQRTQRHDEPFEQFL